MSITMTVMRKGDECQFFADKFLGESLKFVRSAKPAVFVRRTAFTRDPGDSLLTISLIDAKKMAKEILEL